MVEKGKRPGQQFKVSCWELGMLERYGLGGWTLFGRGDMG